MSFFDTLKSAGLWPQQGQGQPQDNPYGLDPAMMRQARMASLGNIGAQILAASMKQTAGQRANVMSNADWTGGYQQNLSNAAQMQGMAEKRQQDQVEQEQIQAAKKNIAGMIKQTPPGRLRDAAMFFFQTGDYAKAGELLWTQKQQFDPMSGQMISVDALGGSAGGASPAAGVPGLTGGSASAPSPGGSVASNIPPPASDGTVDRLTRNWRQLMQDPTLTPIEVRVIASQGSQKGAYDKYAEIVKNRQTQANTDTSTAAAAKSAEQTGLNQDRSAAEGLTKDFDAATKSYDTIIQNGQLAAQVAGQLQSVGKISAADKLATLYQFMKTLDPEGAVRDGDVAMAQSIQSYLAQWGTTISSAVNGGGNISDDVFLEMARSMARMANEASGRKETRRVQMIRMADGRQIPRDMVVAPPLTRAANMPPKPIGMNIPRNAAADDRPLPLPPEDDALVQHFGG